MTLATLTSARRSALLLAAAACLASLGCSRIPGRPGPNPEVQRPEQVLDFPTLYKQNCTACHGESGKNGAALPLNNPVYLAVIGENQLREIITNGVPGKLMPPFAKSAGGMLTDQQVAALAQGIMQSWGKPNLLAGQAPPPYASTQPGDATRGQQAFITSCARCHGATGEGNPANPKTGSIVDPSYLALISDQNLRSIILAGLPDRNMPDWRSDSAQSLTDQQVTDIVAWLTSHRSANPGQPYPTETKTPAGAAQ
jgi:mono/diheme cytochrome c family protein